MGLHEYVTRGWDYMGMLPEVGDVWDPTSNSPKIGDLESGGQ